MNKTFKIKGNVSENILKISIVKHDLAGIELLNVADAVARTAIKFIPEEDRARSVYWFCQKLMEDARKNE